MRSYMGEKKLRFTYLYAILALYWGYCFIVSVVSPPFLAYYTFDETFISDSGVFLWYGVTPRILDWPASPSVLLYGLIFGFSVVFQTISQLGNLTGIFDAFTSMDKVAYNYLFERENYILIGRAIRLFIILGVMLWTLRFLEKKDHPLLSGSNRWYIGIVLIATHLLWNNGVVLRPEAISGVLFICVLCRLFFSKQLQKNEVLSLSFLFGIIVAERLIFLLMSPLFFAGIFLLSATNRLKTVVSGLGFFLLTFVAFCPFVLTDPLIIAKAFFGGILAKVNDSPMTTFFNWEFIRSYFENPIGYLALGLSILGIGRVVKEKNLFGGIVVANWILYLFLVLRSSKIYDPHVLPAALVNLFIMFLGLVTLGELIKRQWIVATVVGLIALGETVNIVNYHSWVRRDTNIYDAYRWIQKEIPSGARLLVNIDVGLLLAPDNNALQRQIDANENVENRLNKLNYLLGLNRSSSPKLEARSFPLSAEAFAFEDEKLFGLQYQLLLKYGEFESRKRFDMDICVDDNTLFYHGILPEQAMEGFVDGSYEYWVTDQELNGYQPLKVFSASDGGPLFVYKANATNHLQ